MLLKYPTPDKMKKANAETMGKLLNKCSNGYFGLGKAQEIKRIAKESFGIEDACGTYSSLITLYLKQIQFITSQVNEIDEKISELVSEIDCKITTICGIGPTLGAVILGEIGDIGRFRSADKFAAYAGIDPTVKQSGDFVGCKNHMSKRGSPYLRRALWQACVIAVQHDPMFKAYYEKKTAEGKRYMNIIGHCTKKMTGVIYAVLRDNKAYEPIVV